MRPSPVTRRRAIFRRLRFLTAAALIGVGLIFPLVAVRATDDVADLLPPNLDKGLRQLVAWHRAQPRLLSASERRKRLEESLPGRAARLQTNPEITDAVVDATLDGRVPVATVRAVLTGLRAEVIGQYDRPGGRGSVLSLRLPLDQAEAAAAVPGVYAVSLVHAPWRRVGRATSQGLGVLAADQVNAMGYDGTGITVGVISDSYDKAPSGGAYPYATHAKEDILNGDLPGPSNPFGHTAAVRVVADATAKDYQTDEGRAMLQIVHDLAPGAGLMFHAAGTTPETLAAAITSLRSQTDPACDVIVDDFGFPDEPFFSDGAAALAAEDATLSLLLPGHPVVYVSAAGNEGDCAYAADFAPVDDATARVGKGTGNLKLEQVPANLTAGGFHNFSPKAGRTVLSQKVKLAGDTEVSFQWDDAFLPGAVTTDYNLLVFDAQGNYQPDLSGTDDNIALGKAVEVLDLPLGKAKNVTYQFAIARTSTGTGQARHLHYVMNGGGPVVKFLGYNHATTFGHNAGPGVIGVAAYDYRHLAEPESFSSIGPVTIYFDTQGNRLATPEVRQQPAVAAVDNVDTSFFPPGPLMALPDGTPSTDTDGDGLPNFSGTSAAAPHVAAVAALLLQAAGGPGSLTAAQVLALLQSSGLPHDLDPNFASATLTPGNGSTVTLSVTADESDFASEDPNGFSLTFDGATGQSLRKAVINLAPTNLQFDTRADLGYAFTIGGSVGLTAADVHARLDAADTTLTLSFTPGAFGPGASLNFGIDRDLKSTGTDGNSADLLAGATVKVHTLDAAGASNAKSVLANNVGAGYSPSVGWGLVNAAAAVTALRANPPPARPGGLVSGNILLTSSDGQILEIQPDGTQVQTFAVPPDPTNGAEPSVYEHPKEALVKRDGNIALLYDAFTEYLFTINAATSNSTVATASGWGIADSFSPDMIVAIGQRVFATYSQQGFEQTPSLLCFDYTTGAVQPFGRDMDPATYNGYTSLAVGPDKMLYAVASDYGGPVMVDVYDPGTLALVRGVTLNLAANGVPSSKGVSSMTIGPAGEFYVLDDASDGVVFKLDATGQTIATLNLLPAGASFVNWTNLWANAQGAVVVGAVDPIVIDPSFQTATILKVFSALNDTYTPTVFATFIP